MATKITKAIDAGGDVLIVRGTIDGLVDDAGNPRPLEARGWVSALSNFYPPSAYNPDGSLKSGASPRAMSAAEKLTYAKRLLQDQHASSTSENDLGISG